MQTKIAANASALKRWFARCEETLGNHSDRLNAINIFPVADGDTGTNLYLTLRSANGAAQTTEGTDLGVLLRAAAEAAMENARGNSGTLLAVLLAAMSEPMQGANRLNAPLLAAALRRAQIRSWSALSDPLQGTMLSVLESAAGPLAAASGAKAMLDISDGLIRDAGRLAGSSGVRIDLDARVLAGFREPLEAAASRLGASALDWVLGGGEDYGLLSAFDGDAQLPHGFAAIGSILSKKDGTAPESAVTVSGRHSDTVGWDHFAD